METAQPFAVIIFQHSEPLLRVHPTRVSELSLGGRARTECAFGLRILSVPLIADPFTSRDRNLYVSSRLAELLGLRPFMQSLHAYTAEGRLVFGPLLGVLCNARWNQKAGRFAASKYTAGLEKLLDAADKEGVLCCLFRMDDLDFARSRVRGFVRSKSNGWHHVWLPLPAAVYDQVISRKLEHSTRHGEMRAKLSRAYGDKIFNDGFFDKWQVYEWLNKDSKLQPHLPRTIRYQRIEEAASFIQKHKSVYLKPIHGSLGLGIIKISAQPDGSFTYDIKRLHAAPIHGRTESALEAVRFIKKRVGARKYLVQQGIPLARYGDRPFDVRIVEQRAGDGQWHRTKIFARIAKPGDITSNLSTGGEALPVSTVLESVLNSASQRRQTRQRISKVTRLITEAMEKESGRSFGEFGIDLGVDERGGVWIIEVNSKPWKSPTTEHGRQDLVDLSFARPIQYMCRLSLRR